MCGCSLGEDDIDYCVVGDENEPALTNQIMLIYLRNFAQPSVVFTQQPRQVNDDDNVVDNETYGHSVDAVIEACIDLLVDPI